MIWDPELASAGKGEITVQYRRSSVLYEDILGFLQGRSVKDDRSTKYCRMNQLAQYFELFHNILLDKVGF